MAKHVVRLQPEAREQLLALVNTRRAAAVKLLHARLWLKADEGSLCPLGTVCHLLPHPEDNNQDDTARGGCSLHCALLPDLPQPLQPH
jgi:hypothetical protein